MLISPDVVPHGGFYFMEGQVKLTGGSLPQLKQTVKEHRESNGKDIGDYEREVEEQICSRWPTGCRGGKQSFSKMVLKFTQVVSNMLKQGWNLEDQAEAERRASICADCPMNLPSKEARKGICSGCQKLSDAALKKLAPTLLQGRVTSHNDKLKTCAGCGCDNSIAIWIPLDVIKRTVETKTAYDPRCWKIQ